MNRSDAEIHLANAMRELRMAMAKDEPYAIELLEIHQQASKLMRQMVGARVVKCEDCDQRKKLSGLSLLAKSWL